jgi:hypothetical protein
MMQRFVMSAFSRFFLSLFLSLRGLLSSVSLREGVPSLYLCLFVFRFVTEKKNEEKKELFRCPSFFLSLSDVLSIDDVITHTYTRTLFFFSLKGNGTAAVFERFCHLS